MAKLSKIKLYSKKTWHFLWHEDSIWSWLANIIVAFILIKFIVYPIISLLLSTQLPIVAVVSGSMEHKFAPTCDRYLSNGLCISYSATRFELCGNVASTYSVVNLSTFWDKCGPWYARKNITQSDFEKFSFSSGFNTGDVMIVRGKPLSSVEVGDVMVWFAKDGTPIIHRVVKITSTAQNQDIYFQTKGDHNSDQITIGARSETAIASSQYVGVAIFRIPWLGNIKLYAVRAIGYISSLF